MKTFIITFFTVLFCLTSSVGWSLEYKDLVKRDGLFYKKFTEVPFTGEVTGKEQGSFKNGLKDGYWVQYYENGELREKGEYKNGLKDGYWIGYYRNGQLWYKGDYKNGVEKGSRINYWENGQLMFKGKYKNGLKDGSWVSFEKDGTIFETLTGTYKDGKKISD